jgi:F420-dependent oxidoreductase-like protein
MGYFDLHIADFRSEAGAGDLFEGVVAATLAAERAGFDAVSVMDHFHELPPFMERSDPIPEAYVLLGALAGRTSTIRLGTLVTGVTYRNPAMLAKMVTTLDVVSGGRAYLGIGASWNEDEYRAYGFGDALLPIRERLDRLEDALRICRAMFAGGGTVEGRVHRIDGAFNEPPPVRPGGPPILVGGGGERRLLRLVARYADIANLFGDAATVRHKLDVLERHCEEVGRNPAEIVKTRNGMLIVGESAADVERRVAAAVRRSPALDEAGLRARCIVGTPDEVAEQAQPLLDAGLDGLTFFTSGLWTPEEVALAGEAIAKLRPARELALHQTTSRGGSG